MGNEISSISLMIIDNDKNSYGDFHPNVQLYPFLSLKEQLETKTKECQKFESQLQEVKDVIVDKELVDKKYNKMTKKLKTLN